MSTYKIVSVLWEDAHHATSQELPKKLSNFITPSLTLGLLYKQDERYMILASHIERYSDHDEADFMLILKDNIIGQKEYGEIEIKKLRNKEDSS